MAGGVLCWLPGVLWWLGIWLAGVVCWLGTWGTLLAGVQVTRVGRTGVKSLGVGPAGGELME